MCCRTLLAFHSVSTLRGFCRLTFLDCTEDCPKKEILAPVWKLRYAKMCPDSSGPQRGRNGHSENAHVLLDLTESGDVFVFLGFV